MRVRHFVLGALGAVFVLAAAAPAFADPDDWHRHEWREHERRAHEWREHEWREHEWRERHGYYGPPIYAPAPAFGYAAPPPAYYGPPGYGYR